MKNYLLLLAISGIANISFALPTVSPKEASKFVGEKVTICGKISGTKGPISNPAKTTTIVLSEQSTASSINVVIRHEDRKNFGYKPEEFLYNKNVCVTGTLSDNHGRTELLINKQDEVKFNEEGNGGDLRPFELDALNRYFDGDRL